MKEETGQNEVQGLASLENCPLRCLCRTPGLSLGQGQGMKCPCLTPLALSPPVVQLLQVLLPPSRTYGRPESLCPGAPLPSGLLFQASLKEPHAIPKPKLPEPGTCSLAPPVVFLGRSLFLLLAAQALP